MQRTLLALTLPLALTACVEFEDDPALDETEQEIINGYTQDPEQSGAVSINGGSCTGSLLTNEWVITAKHCNINIANPANVSLQMGSQVRVGAYAVNHPSLDVTVIRLSSPMAMNGTTSGWRQHLYALGTPALAGQTLFCRGYGCNAYTSSDPNNAACTGGGTLRWGMLPVLSGQFYDAWNFQFDTNAQGQQVAPGDSGGGCYAPAHDGWFLASVHKGGNKVVRHGSRPENWQPWALAYVDEKPVPLPEVWDVPGPLQMFMPRPLPDNYVNQHSWTPCPGNAPYSWTATFDLETGFDLAYVSSSAGSWTLNGQGTTNGTGMGPITVSINTDSSVQSPGILSMPIRCSDWQGRVPPLSVLTHVQNIGDRTVRHGDFAGARQGLRLEGFQINFDAPVAGLGLEYMAHLENIGDTAWTPAGTFVGTRGQSRRLEGFAIRLTGPEAQNYDVSYMAHLQGTGDTVWVKNGEFLGTRGQSLRAEGLSVVVRRRF